MIKQKMIPVLACALVFVASCVDESTDPFGVSQKIVTPIAGTLTLVQGTTLAIENLVYTRVDGNGGRLSDPINGHEVKIMPRAVDQPTWFVMKTLPGLEVAVELFAFRRIDGVWVQITTFATDGVKLRLSYKNTDVKQVNRLRVVYLADDHVSGRLEPLDSHVDKTNKIVQTKLWHFSKYAMAVD